MAEAIIHTFLEHMDLEKIKSENVKIECRQCYFGLNRFGHKRTWKFFLSKTSDSIPMSENTPIVTKVSQNVPLSQSPSTIPLPQDINIHIENTPTTPTFTNSLPNSGERKIVPLTEDKYSFPEWIEKDILNEGWINGGLICFGCQSEVGGFDFRTNSRCRLYLLTDAVNIKELTLMKLANDMSSLKLLTSSDEEFGEDWFNTSQEISSDSEEINLPPRKQKRRNKKRQRKRQKTKKRKESRLKQLLEAEPELQELPDDLVCAVCLDLLHEPCQVEPCGHIFCEPCLRWLGQKDPMNCPCPMCRTRIGFCKHLAATSREIRENHEGLYLRRKKFENGTPVFGYPLPWRPGWRNLIRGRPLGGNLFLLRDNRFELMRAIELQIPYYLPPVVIVNFINVGIFAFMMGFIAIFPSLLSLLYNSGGSNSTTVTNMTLDTTEMSGDILPSDVDTELLPTDELQDGILIQDNTTGFPTLDATFFYVLFALRVVAELAGCFLGFGQEGNNGQRNLHRMSDIVLVVVVTCVPLLMIPTLLPFRDSDGSWFGDFLVRVGRLFLKHMNYHTVLLLILAILFVNQMRQMYKQTRQMQKSWYKLKMVGCRRSEDLSQ